LEWALWVGQINEVVQMSPFYMIRADKAQAVTRKALPHLVCPCHAPSLAIWMGAFQNRAFLAELPGLRLPKQKKSCVEL
jgi:hypothetical protein